MKKFRNILIAFLAVSTGIILKSCDEEPIGQTPVNSDAPAQIVSYEIENINGGAKIKFVAPNDEDLLYVKAEYELNGEVKNTKSSVYSNVLLIRGFGDTQERTVRITTVDKSKNESEPLSVKIHPLTPSVDLIYESMRMIPDFGGVRLYWENVLEDDVVLTFVARDTLGNIFDAENVYTNDEETSYALRGFAAEENYFGVYVKDRYDNASDTLSGMFVPIFEQKLDKNLFKNHKLPGDASTHYGWGHGGNDRMWDDNIWTMWHSPGGEGLPLNHTIDLGVKAKLSRYKYWQALWDWRLYAHQCPKTWEIWGSNDPNPDGSMDGWVKLLDCKNHKPSGLPVGEITNEDKEYAYAGQEFEFSIESEPVRYIRFRMINNWSGADMCTINELSFFGQVVEEIN